MSLMFFHSYDRQLFHDTVVTVTLGWHQLRGLMKYVTAQGSQNMLPLLQQSAKLHKIVLKTAVAQI
jgi:hypothetical protein